MASDGTTQRTLADLQATAESMVTRIKTLQAITGAEERSAANLAKFLTNEADPTTMEHFGAAREHLHQVGQAWRREMIRRDPEHREPIEGVSAATWIAIAAGALANIAADEYERAGEHGGG